MFRSKLGALIFMGFILLAVFRVIGTEGNGGEIATASERIAVQQAPNEPAPEQYQPGPNYDAEKLQADGWGDEVLPPPVQ